ncbi:Aminodeoxychorismate synthase component 1 [Planctomycetes bacterium Pan216]|uniref:aminodeoxychorismate synthase n=1 Tax=Kolteria novifilia TaxID=2527975 RepID=A0A518BCM0_9BACT|nr:Aminodeoxychorismate synthase component 1 [Planctomycetes bacterium Pan216]
MGKSFETIDDRGFALPLSAEQISRSVARQADAAILKSGPGFGDLGRYCLFAMKPRAVFEGVGSSWRLSDSWPGARPESSLGALEALRVLLRQTRTAGSPDLIFQGGWIGYLGYDLAPLLEKLPRRHAADGVSPDLYLAYHDTFAIYDRTTGELRVIATDAFGEGEQARKRRLDAFTQLAEVPVEDSDTGGAMVQHPPASEFTPDEYCAAVARILEYIRAGDIFQANFAHRFAAAFTGHVEHLFERAVERSPAPFGALLRHNDWAVISTSPERYLLVEERNVETRPIKGTRPRGRDPIHDLLLRRELTTSRKDHAELAMIVDLERNDLGRVCQFGSIKVDQHARIESFSNVHHLVSTVTGKLRDDADLVDLIAAAFPGGSITGAPKIRAMQIIDELERCRRGVYTGAIGYISNHGRADFNIAIRTMIVEGGQVHYHVGGGIVADSDPLTEYRETLAKGRRMREMLLGEPE